MTSSVVPISVVIPTIGRAEQLNACLASLEECDPGPAETLVVDQSESETIASIAASFGATVRWVACTGSGVGPGTNAGLREAAHDVVLVTHDDCTVDRLWVATAWRHMRRDDERIITGRVLPVGDARAVPSTIEDAEPRDYTGHARFDVLFPANMALNRSLVLGIGGFDERFGPQELAEDNDFCYRWLRAGYRLQYEPELTVWHHDWRTHGELERLYVAYARGQGFFYAKHLRKGDWTVLRFLLRDVLAGVHGEVAGVLGRAPRAFDWRRGLLRGLPVGLVRGWQTFESSGSAAGRELPS